MLQNTIEISQVQSKADYKAFLNLPYRLYKGEPHWRPPLRFERAAQMDPKKNPSLSGFDMTFLLARQSGQTVGRLAVFLNPEHLAQHDKTAGHFGHLDTEADPAIATALLEAGADILRGKGMRTMSGPYNCSVNEDCGLLIDGFDTPPVIFMPYGRPDYPKTLEALGFAKAKDLHAYMADLNTAAPRPKIAIKMAQYAEEHAEVTLRPLRANDLKSEIELVMDIFNDAWSENWGFLPFRDDQIAHMAKEIKPLLNKNLFWVGEIRGEPQGFILMIPDLNDLIADMDGKLFPFGWAKLLYRLKITKPRRGRVPLMGVRKAWHGKRLGLAMTTALCERVFAEAKAMGIKETELSWILEDNISMIRIIQAAGGEHYKTYRIYEKAIA